MRTQSAILRLDEFNKIDDVNKIVALLAELPYLQLDEETAF